MKPKRVEILGVPVDCLTMSTALDTVDSLIKGDKAGAIVAVNPEKVIRARGDPIFLKQLQAAELLIPDGIGVVWAARLLGLCHMERVPGSELMPAICERAAQKGYKVFLFGARPDVNERAVAVLRGRYPGIQIVGNHHGYVGAEQIPDLIKKINASAAQILFVALGSPEQERWMAKYLLQLDVKVCQGVGGTFDVIVGTVKRAPAIFLKMNLEWLYRLIAQPRRAFRQTALPKFAYQVLAYKWGRKV
jgi:N-acetylglucosaminyldiphosphoundecaprenol N-acetyl-beta-D-mannosaminyltransferase